MQRCRPTRSCAISTCSRPNCSARATASRKPCACAPRWPSAGCRRRHALDLLTAFRMDVTKLRYENWDEVIHYCRYSAMPVGRFVLDVHGESASTWPAIRCAVRRPADQQPPAGLRQGFSRSQPRLPAARCAGGGRRLGRGAWRRKILAADAAMPASACGEDRGAAQRGQGAGAAGQGLSGSGSKSPSSRRLPTRSWRC